MSNTIVDADGVVRYLGNVDSPVGVVRSWPMFGDTSETPLIPMGEWKGIIGDDIGPEDQFIQYVHDQNGYGMCNCSATCSAMERRRAIQGLSFVSLSGGDLYHRIAINGGDNGSYLEKGLSESMSGGVAPTNIVPYLDWKKNYPNAQPARGRFRVLEAFLCPTFGHCMSAVLSREFDLISGVPWFSNYKPGQDGWLPTQGVGNQGGHAVHGYKGTYRIVNGQTQYGIWHKNSWTKNWGINGFCVFPESAYGRAIGGWWAVRSVVDEGGVVPLPT